MILLLKFFNNIKSIIKNILKEFYFEKDWLDIIVP